MVSQPATLAFEVSLNGRFSPTSSHLSFGYHEGLVIRSVTPANGLVSGGALCRINGSGFSNVGTPSCMFGSLRVPATFELTSDVLRCLVPPRDKDGEVAVRVSLNGQQLLPSTVSFRYDHVSPLSSISPSSGPAIGGTSIRVLDVSAVVCAIGTFLDASLAMTAQETHCLSPPANLSLGSQELLILPSGPWDVEVRLSQNGQQFYDESGNFTYCAEPLISTLVFDRGPLAGGTSVTVLGSSFGGGSSYKCRFGSSAMAVSYDAVRDEVYCVPAATDGTAAVAVSLNGQQFTRDTSPLEFCTPPTVSWLLPATGPIGGGTSVVAHGAGFSRGSNYRCRFGSGAASTVAVANMESDGRAVCVAPRPQCGPGAYDEVVEVSINGESFSADGFAFHEVLLTSLDVTSGPIFGGTTVQVVGTGFIDRSRAGLQSECRWAAALSMRALSMLLQSFVRAPRR